MSDKGKHSNRIPFEDLDEQASIASWRLPAIKSKQKPVFGVKRSQAESRAKGAQEVVEDYQGATKPKPLTAAELQALAESAKNEGYEQGYAHGREQGLTAGTKEGQKKGYENAYKDTQTKLQQEVVRLNDIASTLLAPMQAQEKALEKIIVDMAINFSQAIIGRELANSPDSVVNIVEKALAALPLGAKNISVYLNQHDADLVEQYLPESGREWAVVVDSALASGGCKIKTSDSLVDYTVESRLDMFLSQVRSELDLEGAPSSPVTERSEETQTGPNQTKPSIKNKRSSVQGQSDGPADT